MALTGTPAQSAPQTSAPVAGKETAEFKAAKAAAAKKHAEKVKAQKEADYQMALKERDELQKLGVLDKLSDVVKKDLAARCIAPAERISTGGPSFFNTVFGDSPAVGQSITLNDVIKKTYKGMDTMQAYVNKWAKKGTAEVKVELNKASPLETKYTIVKLGA